MPRIELREVWQGWCCREIYWQCCSIHQVPQNTPSPLQLPEIPLTDQPTPLPVSSITFQTPKMSHTNSLNTTNSYNNVWNNCNIADERPQILTWLSPLDPRLRYQDIQDRRVGGVGEWLLQTEEFRSWCASEGCESDDAVLFCYGDPGVGKTYIR